MLAEENPLFLAHQSIDLNGVVKRMPSTHRILAASQHEKRTWGNQGVQGKQMPVLLPHEATGSRSRILIAGNPPRWPNGLRVPVINIWTGFIKENA